MFQQDCLDICCFECLICMCFVVVVVVVVVVVCLFVCLFVLFLFFFLFFCTAQLNMFHVEKRSRSTLLLSL